MRGGKNKCTVCKMHLKLRDQQLKSHIYIQTYTKTTNQKIYNRYTHKKEGIQT